MVLRIKTAWHESKRVHKGKRNRSRPKTLQDRASVIAFNIWKVSQHIYTRMHRDNFKFKTEEQGMGTIIELLAFLLQVVDRMVYGQVPEEERGPFMNSVAQNLARTLQTSREELLGPGDYATPFIEVLNARGVEYAGCSYENGEPGYSFKRVAAEHIATLLTDVGTPENKWVLEQVLDIEIPEALAMIKKLVASALGIKV